nr:unnamed protein product [Spirometra erinaceieuropaei]
MILWDIFVIAATLFSPNSHEDENGYTYAAGQLEQGRSNEITENIDDIFSLGFPNRVEDDFAKETNDPKNVDGQVKRNRSNEIADTVGQIFNSGLANRMGELNVEYPNVVTNGHDSAGGRVKKSRSRETNANIDELPSPVIAKRIAATRGGPKREKTIKQCKYTEEHFEEEYKLLKLLSCIAVPSRIASNEAPVGFES